MGSDKIWEVEPLTASLRMVCGWKSPTCAGLSPAASAHQHCYPRMPCGRSPPRRLIQKKSSPSRTRSPVALLPELYIQIARVRIGTMSRSSVFSWTRFSAHRLIRKRAWDDSLRGRMWVLVSGCRGSQLSVRERRSGGCRRKTIRSIIWEVHKVSNRSDRRILVRWRVIRESHGRAERSEQSRTSHQDDRGRCAWILWLPSEQLAKVSQGCRNCTRVFWHITSAKKSPSGMGSSRLRPPAHDEGTGSYRRLDLLHHCRRHRSASQGAHRPRDWHLLRCQVEARGDVLINTVGTFGVVSASYSWSRLAAAIGRLTQYLCGRAATTWHQLVADDFHLEAGCQDYRSALVSFLVLCSLARVALSWGRRRGGDAVTWVGFELLQRTCQPGISERHASWLIRWTYKVADSQTINITSLEEVFGRVMYIAGPLGYERPFLGPPFRFMTLDPRNSVRLVPLHVKFTPKHLVPQLEVSGHCSCAIELHS